MTRPFKATFVQPDDGEWLEQAACRGKDPELFFPAGESDSNPDKAKTARQICYGCKVRKECLHWAMQTGQDYGIWGGEVPSVRRRLKLEGAVSA